MCERKKDSSDGSIISLVLMRKVKFSKEIRESIKKSSERFTKNIYFNPRKREELRQSFVETRISLLKEFQKPLGSNPSMQLIRERVSVENFIDQMTRLIDIIDNVVPRKLKEFEVKNGVFKLFKDKSTKYTAIKSEYNKGIPKKHYRTCILIPFGFPKKVKEQKHK